MKSVRLQVALHFDCVTCYVTLRNQTTGNDKSSQHLQKSHWTLGRRLFILFSDIQHNRVNNECVRKQILVLTLTLLSSCSVKV